MIHPDGTFDECVKCEIFSKGTMQEFVRDVITSVIDLQYENYKNLEANEATVEDVYGWTRCANENHAEECDNCMDIRFGPQPDDDDDDERPYDKDFPRKLMNIIRAIIDLDRRPEIIIEESEVGADA